MKDLDTLPTTLTVCGLSASGQKLYPKWLKKPTGERPFRIPHVPLEKSPLWISLKDMHIHNMPDSWCESRIVPFFHDIKMATLAGDTMIQHMPTSVLERHGGLAWHTLRRVWDLNLAYATPSPVRGLTETTDPARKFGLVLKDATFNLFYKTIFKDQLGRALYKWKKEAAKEKAGRGIGLPFKEDYYLNHYDDVVLRIKGEHRIADYLHDVASDDPFDIIVAESKLGNPELTAARCEMTVRHFHKATGPNNAIDEDVCEKYGYMLRSVAARMVVEWDKISPTEAPTIETVARELCINILKVLNADVGVVERVLKMRGYGTKHKSQCIID